MGLARPVVFGNWKMNGLRAEGLALAGALAERAVKLSGTLGIFPPFTLLHAVAQRVAGSGILVGGQDCHEQPMGAFTGSIGAPMLADAGAKAVILGHSERRHGLGETDERIRAKFRTARAHGLLVVLCVGETEAEYLAGARGERLRAQLAGSLPPGIGSAGFLVAYEPVWAIGTGKTATPQQAQQVHAFIRSKIAALDPAVAQGLRIQYGGSMKANNAAELLAQPDIDGGLIGGASLVADEFLAICRAA